MDIAWMITLFVAFIISRLFYSIWNSLYRRGNLPPGPTPFPVVGNVLQIRKGQLVTSLIKFAEKYGSVYTIYFGHKPVVILSGYETVKEALVDQAEDFGGRGKFPSVDEFFAGTGISFSNGEVWKDLRRFSITILRNFGMGKKSIEERIQEEASFLVAEINTFKQRPFNPTNLLVQAVSNVICSIVFGDRFEYDNQSFQQLLSQFEKTFRAVSSTWGQMADILPEIMKYVPGPHQRICSDLRKLETFVMERVKINQETLDPNSPRDYTDCFLIKHQKEKNNPSFNTNNMIMSILSLFFAGTETISTTLRHSFLIFMKYPEIQAKIHKEIDQVIGEKCNLTIDDRSKMPYTNAVIHEIQRFCDILPFSLPHAVTKDVSFKGYTIPKGTDVFPLLCSVHRDPRKFSNPDKFNPNHFLDSNGSFMKNDGFMVFSAGKRVCLGEGLARTELFIFLTTILKNFKLTSKTKFTEEDITPQLNGFANVPIPYEMSFIPRETEKNINYKGM
ncbi:cytochrome P450 2G1-like [Gastrophryne carolinensis]